MIVSAVRILGTGELVDIVVSGSTINSIVPSRQVLPRPIERVALPGLVDLHTHLREPGDEEAETIETGTRAAAAGGFTDVFAMPNTNPPIDTVDRVRMLRRLIREGPVHAGVHVIAAASTGRQGKQLVDVAALVDEGVTMFSDDGSCLDDAELVRRILVTTAKTHTVFAQHAQSHKLAGRGVVHSRIAKQLGVEEWPRAGEESVIARDIELAAQTGGYLHVCHVSTEGSVELIRQAKADGVNVTTEVTPHHLVLTDDDVLREGALLKVNPPLREIADAAAVRGGLRDGTIDIVATDHAPHSMRRKQGEISQAAFGLTGLETALAVVSDVLVSDSGETDWGAVARVLSYTPAQIGSLDERMMSTLGVGSRATFCVVETSSSPLAANPVRSRSLNSPFGAYPLRARVLLTVREGLTTFKSAGL